MSWRTQQLQGLGCKILQDEYLVDFVNQHGITVLELDGEDDVEYFRSRLPTCKIGPVCNNGLLAVFVNQLDNKLEEVLLSINKKIQSANPDWVYIAINKYLITTDQSWSNLTDNYDQDLIDIVSLSVLPLNFLKVKQSYIKHDDGKYFNFVHPTTNMYYEKKLCM
jgi:hypothetical protein